jgi:DNA modification methylase
MPYYEDGAVTLHLGDCLDVLATLPVGSVDAVVCDPPYPEIDRAYGRWTEEQWHVLMRAVVAEVRRVLTPTGSAVFVLQPNSERVGRLRPWLWDFLAWASREWNVVQDAWWWNHHTAPLGGAPHAGLLRPSLKMCVWLGPPDCYRDQDAVLWTESQLTTGLRLALRAGGSNAVMRRRDSASEFHRDRARALASAERRGGVTPYNVLPLGNSARSTSAGAFGHGAGTPVPLCAWWIRYLCPSGGTVLDPFAGVGSTAVAAVAEGRRAVLIERHEPYCRATVERLRRVQPGLVPFEEAAG